MKTARKPTDMVLSVYSSQDGVKPNNPHIIAVTKMKNTPAKEENAIYAIISSVLVIVLTPTILNDTNTANNGGCSKNYSITYPYGRGHHPP